MCLLDIQTLFKHLQLLWWSAAGSDHGWWCVRPVTREGAVMPPSPHLLCLTLTLVHCIVGAQL